MPPKKGKKGKKGKGDKDGPSVGGPLTPEDTAKMFAATNLSLQMQLANRTDDASQALAEKRSLQARVETIRKEYDESQQGVLEITRDMTRQYKALQQELVEKNVLLSHTVHELKDQLDEADHRLEQVTRDKDAVIAAKDEEIALMKQKMEDMAQEFGVMLKETLDKMRERIDLSSNFDMGNDNVPIHQQISEVKM